MLDGIKHEWDVRPQTLTLKLNNGKGSVPITWTCQFCSVTIQKQYERPNAVLKEKHGYTTF